MSELRKACTMGLLLLLCALSGHFGESAPRGATAAARSDSSSRQYAAIVKHMDRSRDHSSTETATRSPGRREPPTVPRDLRNLRAERADKNMEISTREIRKKEKFLKHLTGPLYFSPKCRKHVYRLYHNTRVCTIPACKFCNHNDPRYITVLSSV
ncbi:ALK and LTK ligand 2 [Merluccius polli]|uniref:ALK and LTK ligand 2 n=1 Tax=Merluccius polli TaxID=89951 RepID=A0AA47NXQ6_MERPO|nr:ALK and LTK ligand 2 [Merluccius polli]